MFVALYAGAWTIIGMVAVGDCLFAYALRDTLMEWEANPFVRWAVHEVGLWFVLIWRLASVALASFLVGRVSRRLATWATVTVLGAHVGLILIYVQLL